MTGQTNPIDPTDTAILLIEFQREWLDEDGKINPLMKDRAQFDSAIKGGQRLLAYGRENNIQIVHSGLRFQAGYPELGHDGLGLRGAIKRFGTFPMDGKGSQWGDGFAPHEGEFIVHGRTGGSAFAGSNLDVFLRANRINTLLIGGFALHVCVESTLRHGHDLGYDCLIVEEAVAAFTAEQRAHVLQHVVHHYGATVTLKSMHA